MAGRLCRPRLLCYVMLQMARMRTHSLACKPGNGLHHRLQSSSCLLKMGCQKRLAVSVCVSHAATTSRPRDHGDPRGRASGAQHGPLFADPCARHVLAGVMWACACRQAAPPNRDKLAIVPGMEGLVAASRPGISGAHLGSPVADPSANQVDGKYEHVCQAAAYHSRGRPAARGTQTATPRPGERALRHDRVVQLSGEAWFRGCFTHREAERGRAVPSAPHAHEHITSPSAARPRHRAHERLMRVRMHLQLCIHTRACCCSSATCGGR